MSEYIPVGIRKHVRERASQACEYCLIHEDDSLLPHEPDHIIAVKHRGKTTEGNLAWTCFTCNRSKPVTLLPSMLRQISLFGYSTLETINGRSILPFCGVDAFAL